MNETDKDKQEEILLGEYLRCHVDGETFQDSLKDIYCVCDCEKAYGKRCKYPEKYLNGGCK